MRTLPIAMLGLLVTGVGGAGAASAAVTCIQYDPASYCVINNGLAPPNLENVIDDGTYQDDGVLIRNVGCPPGWPVPAYYPWDPCPSPGAPTEVYVEDGANVGGGLLPHDSCSVAMDGGVVEDLYTYGSSTTTLAGGTVVDILWAHDSSAVTMSGGTVGNYVRAIDSSTITMTGGAVGTYLYTYGSGAIRLAGGTVGTYLRANSSLSTITIAGTDFEVDGEPVPYGDLTSQTGTLTGTLQSGDPINNVFYQGGWTGSPCSVGSPCSGTITLVPACGDELIEGPEECDDGDTNPGDGCNPSCQIETGWICEGEPSVCTEHVLPTLSPWSQLALMAGLLGAGLGAWGSRAK